MDENDQLAMLLKAVAARKNALRYGEILAEMPDELSLRELAVSWWAQAQQFDLAHALDAKTAN